MTVRTTAMQRRGGTTGFKATAGCGRRRAGQLGATARRFADSGRRVQARVGFTVRPEIAAPMLLKRVRLPERPPAAHTEPAAHPIERARCVRPRTVTHKNRCFDGHALPESILTT